MKTAEPSRACERCRFWSMMMSEFRGQALVALCLAAADKERWTTERDTCDDYAPPDHGYVDDPARWDPSCTPWPPGYNIPRSKRTTP